MNAVKNYDIIIIGAGPAGRVTRVTPASTYPWKTTC